MPFKVDDLPLDARRLKHPGNLFNCYTLISRTNAAHVVCVNWIRAKLHHNLRLTP